MMKNEQEQVPSDFEKAGKEILAFLHKRLGFNLWMITRKEGDNWIVLQAEDHGYDVEPGLVLRWADTLCAEMVKGNGPHIAPQTQLIPAYASAPAAKIVDVNAYVGVPLSLDDGEVFGTLCAIDPNNQPESLIEEQALLELYSGLLSTILRLELKANEEARRAELALLEAMTDFQTGLYNRRGWEKLMAAEEARCRRYGSPAAITIIDLDGLKHLNDTQGHNAGDEMIDAAANALQSACRAHDVIARLGGDEFGVLSIECDQSGSEILRQRIQQALDTVGVKASMGLNVRDPATTLEEVWASADKRMYENKRINKEADGN